MSLVTPPIFLHADDLYIFDSVQEAESCLEPADVEPGEVAYDVEGRLLRVVVRDEVHRSGCSIDQSRARVEWVLVEDQPTRAEELRRVLVEWLGRVEPQTDIDRARLSDLVQRGWTRKARRSASMFAGAIIGASIGTIKM